jgi:hypothetical protein
MARITAADSAERPPEPIIVYVVSRMQASPSGGSVCLCLAVSTQTLRGETSV